MLDKFMTFLTSLKQTFRDVTGYSIAKLPPMRQQKDGHGCGILVCNFMLCLDKEKTLLMNSVKKCLEGSLWRKYSKNQIVCTKIDCTADRWKVILPGCNAIARGVFTPNAPE